ncbi:MAG: hypothetical protein L3J54_12195, partial [Draconibacterium sp.]|nr:hypothetical protein [Draconibacterium sp.]
MNLKHIYLSIILIVILFLSSCISSVNKEAAKKTVVPTHKNYMVVAYVAGYRDFDFTTIDVSG